MECVTVRLMAKNKKKKKGGYTPPVASPKAIVDSIVQIAEKIGEPDAPSSLWGDLHKAFLKSEVDSSVAAKIIMHKDIPELQQVVAQDWFCTAIFLKCSCWSLTRNGYRPPLFQKGPRGPKGPKGGPRAPPWGAQGLKAALGKLDLTR